MSMRRLSVWAGGFIALAAVLWLIVGRWEAPIEAVHPVRGRAVQAVYATGTVEATVMMPIAARSPARLMQLNVDEGSHVRAGETLAQLEDEDLQRTLDQLQAQERLAKTEFERNARLARQKIVAPDAFDRARSNWDAAKAAVAKATAEANFMKLVAPADGDIIRRDGEIGQMIPANQPIFWLACCAPLRISTEVDEEDIARVERGQVVLIRADAFPGRIFHGVVQAITPKGDPVSRSYRVRVGFTEDAPLKIGMTAETNIMIRESEHALLLPASAVREEKIWRVEDGHLAHVPVSIGARGPQQIEILDGVGPDDLVVLKPDGTLVEGRRVRTNLVTQAK